ncbi:thioredoxin family protein [Streptomyces sviceus]|uniref:thioredoxin family protein n=1 Tax=Streptomyces sviceus TaxID=285530 RepID=UPI0036C9A597
MSVETVTGSGIALIAFWAAWCGPCRAFGPVCEKAAERHRDIAFGKAGTEAQPELADAFRILSVPTLMTVRDRAVLSPSPESCPRRPWRSSSARSAPSPRREVRRKAANAAGAY